MHTTAPATLHLPGPAAAERLGVSLRTLQRLAERGDVARHQLGRRTLYAVPAPAAGATPAPPAPRPQRRDSDATADAMVTLATRAAGAELEAIRLRSELEGITSQLEASRARVVELEGIARQLGSTCTARAERIKALLASR
jgi:predicted DNA-binding protein (UPF0251 family)